VYVEDHKADALVPAADAVCVPVSAASANTLSVITLCRTRTSIPPCTACANAGPRPVTPPRGGATSVRPFSYHESTARQSPRTDILDAPRREALSRSAVWRGMEPAGTYGSSDGHGKIASGH